MSVHESELLREVLTSACERIGVSADPQRIKVMVIELEALIDRKLRLLNTASRQSTDVIKLG